MSDDRSWRRALGRAWLDFFGWTIEGGAPDYAKAVIIAYPHTSNWDLPFMLAVAYAIDVDIKWLGKKELFDGPGGSLMRWLGGIPVDRSRRTHLVDAMVDTINDLDEALVVIPPEGTRSNVGRWKTGFYWVAVGAKVPIILGFLDFGNKVGGLGEVLHPSGDIEADLEIIKKFYEGKTGLYPDEQGEIRLG
jgi:1-acyl-sn-glycerol-3-phosphate acyltransferase